MAGLLSMMRVWNWGKRWLKWSRKGNTTLGRIFTSGLFEGELVLKLSQLKNLGTEVSLRLPEYIASGLNGYMVCVSTFPQQTVERQTVERIGYGE